MPELGDKPRWALPYATELPADPAARRRAVVLRVVAYVVLAAFLIVPAVQFQHGTLKNARRAARAPQGQDVKTTKGAIGRWRYAVRDFWAGRNIYVARAEAGGTALHPNMPFTVILLTPFAYLPLGVGTALFNALKIAAVVAAMLLMIRVADHGGSRMPPWAAALGALWAIKLIVGDIQHGNTNGFVLAALVLHLWLYRRGRDLAAGAALAGAICLKMTPALFLGYWLYQRSWKVLIGALVALVVFGAAVPVAAVGPQRAVDLTQTWLDNLIIPGLVKGEWYPIHVNQSISGVLGRYLLGGGQSGGDIFWAPDDTLRYGDQTEHGWIAFVSLSEDQAKLVVRAVQLALVALGAWAIGWRRLPRDDGRRALHYGMVAVGMMLLNQRTWDHHATVLLVAAVPIWYAIARAGISRSIRGWAMGLMVAAAACLWGSSSGVFMTAALLTGRTEKTGEAWTDWVMAYGPVFYHFLMFFAAAGVLSVALRRKEPPYLVPRESGGGQTSSI
ncbi:MAG: DUF2029 domain-containing protein [Phycisphaerae bacterium]|nr:DUF2029 domain-containing protein [Phycisphaerae bacterium]